jgi:DNA mismatch repair protein MutS
MVHSKEFYKLYQDTYLHYRKIYGDKVAVFLQKGSFWEFYGIYDETTQTHENSVKEFTDILGVQVNYYAGDAPDGKTGLFAGVPEHVLDKWAGRLTSIGWTVVVITQEKNTAGAVIDRKVSRVLSPGTHVENIEASSSCIVASMYADAIVAIDTTTGTITFYSGDTEHIKHFLQIYPPKECIADQAIDTCNLYCPSTIFYKKDYLKTLEKLGSSLIARELYLQDIFKPRTILPFNEWLGMGQNPQIALVAALLWLRDHYPNLIVYLPKPIQWHPGKNMRIINNALQQVNIIGHQKLTIAKLFVPPYTAPGKRVLPQLLSMPHATAEKIRSVQEKVAYCMNCTQKSAIENKLRLLSDIPRIHRLIVRGAIRAGTALQLHQSYSVIRELCGLLHEKSGPWSASISTIDDAASKCMTAFDTIFDREKALQAMNESADWGFLHDTVGPKTAAMENSIKEIYAESDRWLDGLVKCVGLAADSITYKPTDSNVFALHAAKSVLEKIAASAAVKNNPTYAETKIKSLKSAGKIEHSALEGFNERLEHRRSALSRAFEYELNNACIHYSELTATPYWSLIEEWMTDIDCTMAYANTTARNGWVMPVIAEGDHSSVSIKKLRHPLIEAQQNTQIELVTHDVELTAKKGMLLYGVNSSGKSSLMKSLGIAVILAQLGCGVPAVEMRITPYNKIATRIINHDNLWAGLSSFAVEMSELREILTVADENTLVLGDELCSGTETDSATALVAAGIDWLLKAGSSFILATHLHDLMKFTNLRVSAGLAVYHLRVHHDVARDCLVYDRTLVPGSGPSTYGITVAKALHLPADLLESAQAYRKQLTGTADANRASNPYNDAILKRKCEVCEKEITTDLEIHHINEQAASTAKRNTDGTDLNSIRNLVVVCTACHDRHHAGSLTIGPVQQTTAGPLRTITYSENPPTSPKKKKTIIGGFTEDEIAGIIAIREKYPKLDKKLIVHQIKNTLQIDITVAQLNAVLRKIQD